MMSDSAPSDDCRVVVSSVARRAADGENSGFVRVVSLGAGAVLAHTAIPESSYRQLDDNPRGGLRGARGVSSWGDRLVIANTERVLIVDRDWQLAGELTHPLMGGIHDILAEEDGIWVTCTAADLLLQLSWTGEVLRTWEWRQDPGLRSAFGLDARPVDRTLDYRDPTTARRAVSNSVHLNAVSRCPEGLLLSFGRVLSPQVYRKRRMEGFVTRVPLLRRGRELLARRASARRKARVLDDHAGTIRGSTHAIVLLRDNGSTEVIERNDDVTVPNHNALWVDGWLVYNDTNACALVGVNVVDGERRSVSVPGNPGFARGLAHLDGLEFVVGCQYPTAIHRIDLASGSLVASVDLQGSPAETVYGVTRVPPSFGPVSEIALEQRVVEPAS